MIVEKDVDENHRGVKKGVRGDYDLVQRLVFVSHARLHLSDAQGRG